jgi:hypothetical protein
VTGPLTPSLERAREELEKSGTRAKLMTFASWRAHNGPDTDDLLQEALAGTCEERLDEARTLDPAGEGEARVEKARREIEDAIRPDARGPEKPRGQ